MSVLIDGLSNEALKNLREQERKHAKEAHTFVFAYSPKEDGTSELLTVPIHDDGKTTIQEALAKALEGRKLISVLLMTEARSTENKERFVLLYGADVTGIHTYAVNVSRDEKGRIMVSSKDPQVYAGNTPDFFSDLQIFGLSNKAEEAVITFPAPVEVENVEAALA